MAKVSPLVLIPPVAFAALAGLFAFGMFRDNPDELPSAFVGRAAPELSAEALPGYAALDPELFTDGAVTLVNFWASWCPPCRLEHDTLHALNAAGIDIVGVNFRDQAENATQYLQDDGNPFVAVPFDPRGRSALDWGVSAPPETFIVAGDGTVLYRHAGPLVDADFVNRFLPRLEEALGEPRPDLAGAGSL